MCFDRSRKGVAVFLMQHNFRLGLAHGRGHDEGCVIVIDESVVDGVIQDSRK